MILDELLEFADALDVSAAAGTAAVGDVIDLGAVPQDFGHGKPMYLVIQVTTAFATGTTAEASFVLASDASATLAADGTETRHIVTPAFDTGDLPAGKQLTYPLPLGDGQAYERYLGIEVITTTGTTSAGSINAFLTFDPSYWKSYADAAN